MKRLVVIDGKSVFYRGYYAMGALSTSDGVPTGGIYGFAAIAMEIVRSLNPTKVIVAWDSPTSTAKRKAIFPEYKAGRKRPGEDFYAQIPMLKELILALGWGFVECDDYEADDIIGTLSRQADEEMDSNGKCAWMTYIVSSDLDMLQIVDENTRMYRVLKGFSRLEEIDVAAVEAKYGIKKAQFLDLKALKGDASDNIPGVPGIGEKTAVKLLNDFGSLEGVYKNIVQIKGKTREKLEAGKESAEMSYLLAKIMTDAPVELNAQPDFVVDKNRVIAALKKLQFRTLIAKFEKWNGQDVAAGGDSGGSLQVSSAALQGNSSQVSSATLQGDSNGISGNDYVKAQGLILSWDIKATMHRHPELAQGLLTKYDKCAIMEGEGDEKTLSPDFLRAKIEELGYYDLGQGAFLLNPLAREIEQGDEQAEFERQMLEFAERPKLYKLFVQFDLLLIPVLYKMEKAGMLIDKEHFAQLKKDFTAEVESCEQKIYQLAGVKFNINSPVQLSDVLFNKLRLPTRGIKKTTRGYSTGAKELDKLQGLHPIIEKIKEYREVAKLLSTYIVPLPELADAEGRVHTTFNQNVTATGRLSSTNPNLQNIPVRTEIGRGIRTGFIASDGCVLVNADYSQFELRLAAAMGNDKALIDDFNRDLDIHTKTAAEAFNVPMDKVSKVQRRAAKVINFGILYGMSIRGLAEAAGMGFYEAKDFIERYFELRKPLKDYLNEILKQARERGYVETFYGRRRPTPDVLSSNFIVRTGAERAAQNMPIQGTEADLMKRAMLRVDKALPEGAKLIMQVHDSLMVECKTEDAKLVAEVLKKEMEGAMDEDLPVKLKVDVAIAKNWGEM